jgi:hypothetical protein
VVSVVFMRTFEMALSVEFWAVYFVRTVDRVTRTESTE